LQQNQKEKSFDSGEEIYTKG
jgi:hypothetical protein